MTLDARIDVIRRALVDYREDVVGSGESLVSVGDAEDLAHEALAALDALERDMGQQQDLRDLCVRALKALEDVWPLAQPDLRWEPEECDNARDAAERLLSEPLARELLGEK